LLWPAAGALTPCHTLLTPLFQDKTSDEQRAAAFALAAALARAGGSAMWAMAGAAWEECCRACAAALEDGNEVGWGHSAG
jgi:hypothetical protein